MKKILEKSEARKMWQTNSIWSYYFTMNLRERWIWKMSTKNVSVLKLSDGSLFFAAELITSEY